MASKPRYIKPSYASTGGSKDTSAPIFMSMLMSAAWLDLTKSQQILYIYCAEQVYGEKRIAVDGQPNAVTFTMNRYKWNTLYKLYSDGNAARFYADRDALIEHGFIRVAQSIAKEKTVYALIDKWQRWPKIDIHPNDMSAPLQKKYRDKQKTKKAK
jgi:hypothetical protein